MAIQSSNPSSNLAIQPQAGSNSQSSLFFMNGDYCYVQFRVSTKKALTITGGAGLMLLGKLNPALFDVIWALIF